MQILSHNICVFKIRPILFDLNSFELYHYPFMVRLDKYNRNCNAVDDLSTKIRVLSETKVC